ncbi:ParA family protein [Piscirickettsia salmonis]|uniref:ParA family protein n=1 Tax=Piscirickettsia salmonis TaxID=1238 RepID=UPI0012BA8A28|nr:ParA family protein [Piscirickettsia salmonis]
MDQGALTKNRADNMSKKKSTKVIAIANQKGGATKTTVTYTFAHILARKKKKVLVVDADPQANLTYALTGIEEASESLTISLYDQEPDSPIEVCNNLWLYAADQINLASIPDRGYDAIFQLKDGLDIVKDDFDYVLIDCLPSLGSQFVSCLHAATHILVPMTADVFSPQGLSALVDIMARMKKKKVSTAKILGVLINNHQHNTVLSRETERELREVYGDLVFTTVIRKNESVRVSLLPNCESDVTILDKNAKVSKEFKSAVSEMLKRVGDE